MKRRILTLAVYGGIFLSLLAGMSGALLAHLGSEPEIIEISVALPPTVIAGQPFEADILIENVTGDQLTIVSLGLDRVLVENGITIQRTVPAFRRVDNPDGKWREYAFSIQRRPVILANQSLRLPVTIVATQTGTFEGELTVWMENVLRSDYLTLHLNIVAHPAPWLAK